MEFEGRGHRVASWLLNSIVLCRRIAKVRIVRKGRLTLVESSRKGQRPRCARSMPSPEYYQSSQFCISVRFVCSMSHWLGAGHWGGTPRQRSNSLSGLT
ncbi:hypothetical protein IG631_17563 [Alternaria alternata]|nr:hypothetical protein IG631_17563 [Alternaria alternata]